ncbi:chitobiase/beta-hexosaminidase C-terminal domain-containing protein [Prevotella communis]|uniref:chitobiase/beta-hexosaminidase C-terminal domain-containing protein n=1 Tax=Prevotella communis TaxID=2913614 RepID=UPI001EDBE63A|nr:chitobiase/beta-hexosaminidase C-terminal domain-containing protein [Prevotella communis]UKK67008.1 chitobiase/beta-hexosaminidase C-terminal domain-containing protein [Prevotella communis]UKK70853.1 chitobiase/beta-hexosaminidase C-terminal domain-containing protein [Prevotella communis]
MNKNTISKWFSMFVLMMAGITGATAQSLTVADATLVPGKTKVVSISLDAAEGQTIYGIQTDITLSKGLKINAATAANTTLHFNQNKLESGATRVALLSLGGEAIPAGEAIKLTIEADASFKNGTVDLANTKLTTTATGTEINVDATSAIIDTYDCLPYQKYIIGNYTSEKFLGAGNGWGTQASLVAHPEYVKLDYNEADGTYKLESQVSNGGNKYYFNGDYMDSNAPVSLTLKKIEEPLGYQDEEETKPIYGYTISDGDNYFGWDGTSTVLGKNLTATDENAIWLIMPLDEAKAGLVNATLEEPLDATMLIEDHDFGRNNRYQDKWTMVASNQNLSGGEDKNGTIGNNCAESWHSTFTLSQTLADAPAGIYALTAQGFYGQDGSDNEHLPVFYANDATQTFPLKTGSEASMTAASQSFSAGKYTIEPLVFELKEGETLTIGAKLEGNTSLWCIWDNFTLTYYGKNTTIEDVKAESLRKQVDELREKAFSLFNETEVESIKAVLDNAINSTESVSGAEAINNAIATLKTAIEKGEASLEAKAKLAKMKELIDATNVYTAEAKNEYYDQWEVKYLDGTITKAEANALQDPFLVTGWRANVNVDDLLMSVWDEEPMNWDSYHVNTWSTEGENDGSEFKVPFIEYWTGDGDSLAVKTLTATINGVEPGIYDVTAWVRIRRKNTDSAIKTPYGITMQANDDKATTVCDGTQVGTSQFYLKEVTTTGTVAEDGVLKIKFNVAADNNISWLSFKNVNYALHINPDKEELAAPQGWYSLISNGNLASEDVTSFLTRTVQATEFVGANIVPGAGEDQSRGIVVKTNESNLSFDTQFYINFSEALPKGTKLHVEFDYKAKVEGSVVMFSFCGDPLEPADLHKGYLIEVSKGWNKFSQDITVEYKNLKSLGIFLNCINEANTYYFDNFGVWAKKPVKPANPIFTPAGGEYSKAKKVTIACETEGASIYYTLDGTIPTAKSTLYTEPIAISETTTVKAIAVLEDQESRVVEATYTITPLDDSFVEIAQSQSSDIQDGASRATVVEGEGFTQYTTDGNVCVIFKMYDVNVKNCDYVVVKFAEPVPAGIKIAFWAQNGTDNVEVPAGVTEYKYVFAEDAKCAIANDILPQITLLTLWNPQTVKVEGVYKHQLPVADAISNITTDAQKTAIFNLNGQKVNKAQKGLFIINGKKVLVK